MKCPHCKHRDNYIDNSGYRYAAADDKDKFFRLSDYAKRMINGKQQIVEVYGCPICKKLFIREELK